MGAIRKRGKIWYIDYVVAGRRIKKRVGPSKSLAELALKDIEVKIAKNELGFLPKDSDLQNSRTRNYRSILLVHKNLSYLYPYCVLLPRR